MQCIASAVKRGPLHAFLKREFHYRRYSTQKAVHTPRQKSARAAFDKVPPSA